MSEVKKRLRKRFEEICKEEGVLYDDVKEIYESQFAFTKAKIESLTKDHLSKASDEVLNNLVFKYMYLGKLFSAPSLQKYGNNKNNITNNKDGENNQDGEQ